MLEVAHALSVRNATRSDVARDATEARNVRIATRAEGLTEGPVVKKSTRMGTEAPATCAASIVVVESSVRSMLLITFRARDVGNISLKCVDIDNSNTLTHMLRIEENGQLWANSQAWQTYWVSLVTLLIRWYDDVETNYTHSVETLD